MTAEQRVRVQKAEPRGSDSPADLGARKRAQAKLDAFHEEAGFGRAYDKRLIGRLWPLIYPYRRLLGLALAVILVAAVLSLFRPLIMRTALDDGVLQGRADILMRGGLILTVVLLVEQLLLFVQTYALQIVGARSMADLRRTVFRFLHGQRLGFFDSQPVGRLVTRVTNDVDAVLELFASGALNALGDMVRLVGIVALMLMLDAKLSLIAFAATPLVGFMVVFVRKRLREAFREIRAKTAQMNAAMNEQVNGMAVVQAFNHESASAREFDQINQRYRDANIRSIKFEAMQDAAIEMVAAVCLASIVIALGYHPVSFGTLVAFNAYLVMFFEPITALAQRYVLLQSAMAGAERVFALLDQELPDAPARGGSESSSASGPASSLSVGASAARAGTSPLGLPAEAAIVFEHVSFGYKPSVKVLHDINLVALRGEKLALVGPTGSGKSTIASLLLRLYEVDEGSILIDGINVQSLDRNGLRSRFSVVPQDVYLFPGTIASNIAAGEPDLVRVEQVLRKLDAYNILARRPLGILAPVEERATNFSVGERQLIAFARALYRDAPFVIMDEATASVDSDTESRLQKATQELLAGRTGIIIAHRLSTIRAADRIVVLQAGRVVESGTHEALLREGGLYNKLHSLQFKRQLEPGEALTSPKTA